MPHGSGATRHDIMRCFSISGLVAALGAQELAVQAGDVAQLDVLGALSGTGTRVGAVTEAQLVHLGRHGQRKAHTHIGRRKGSGYLYKDIRHSRYRKRKHLLNLILPLNRTGSVWAPFFIGSLPSNRKKHTKSI